ncbi:hypothetical protein D352_00137 [Enterococcus faecium LA4B-2]|nr:hypothetical protein D352_00137 [Enterococcus faecium LA4B-2]
MKTGWSVNDIENTNFNRLIQIVCSEKSIEKPKEMDLKDFLKSI